MEPWENRLYNNLDALAEKHECWDNIRQNAYTKQPRKTGAAARPIAVCASLVMLTAIGFFAYGLMQSPADPGIDPDTNPDTNPVVSETDEPSETPETTDDPVEDAVIPSIEPYDPWDRDDIVILDIESGLYADVTPDKMLEDTGHLLMKNRDTGETYVVLSGTNKGYPVSDKFYGTGELGAIDIQYDDEIGVLFVTVQAKGYGSAIISHEVNEELSGFFYGENSIADEPICLTKISKGKWEVYGADVTVGADVSELTLAKNDTYYGYFTLEVAPNRSAWDFVKPDTEDDAHIPAA